MPVSQQNIGDCVTAEAMSLSNPVSAKKSDAAATPARAVNDYKVLVVDDDATVRRKLERLLRKENFRTILAHDVPTAFSALHKSGCDLILLDVELPGVDGLALCRLLRAQPNDFSRLPIIMLSATADEARRAAAFAAGADDFVAKSTGSRELIARVNAHLAAAERERTLVGTNRELNFLADLGRGLLYALDAGQVARRVAGTTYEATNAALCAAIIATPEELRAASGKTKKDETAKFVACVFDREGSAEDESLVRVEHLKKWLAEAPTAATRVTDRSEFLLRDDLHLLEYVAPLRFENKVSGALVAAFDRAGDLTDVESRLVDAAAQLTALAARISLMYEAARSSSVSLAKEVERRAHEAEAQRRLTEAILDSLPVSLYAIDRSHRIVAWNRNRELGGQGVPREQALGKTIFEVLTKQPRKVLENEFERVFETGEIERVEQKSFTHEGATRYWLVSKIPMRAEPETPDAVSHVITLGEDVTARVEANRLVARAEKLSAVGRLAAGVVHEINNPLATISACAEALESRAKEGAFDGSPESADLLEYLSIIRSEAFRCKQITNGLLDFSRNRVGEFAPVEIRRVIEAAARLVQHQKRSGQQIEIKTEVEADLPYISGDEGQLQQALIALATNAIDAMPDSGTLTFAARRQASNIILEVSDTGVGIKPEHVAKIFDPFYTTKEVGRGTGLGLAVCYGIVTEHGGRITVSSAVGQGTTFRVSLPAI